MTDTATNRTDAPGRGASTGGAAGAASEQVGTRVPAAAQLDGAEVAAFCDGCAVMLAAGIQTDEAVCLVTEGMGPTPLHRACDAAYAELCRGKSLADALRATGAFPAYAVTLIGIGERSGRLEDVLRSLSVYYDEEARTFARLRSSVAYPAGLLCVMSVILAFTVVGILPVFLNVYDELAGGLTGGSFTAVGVGIVVGWVALVVTLAACVVALVAAFAVRTPAGQERILALLERLPATRDAMYQLALSRFCSAASAYLASGADSNTAVHKGMAATAHPLLHDRLVAAHAAMVDPSRGLSLPQAIVEFEVFDPVYARMLAIGSRTGSMDGVLERLSATFFDAAVEQIDRVVDAVEPVLAALLTVSVGATLVAVMLPLVGMLGAIG